MVDPRISLSATFSRSEASLLSTLARKVDLTNAAYIRTSVLDMMKRHIEHYVDEAEHRLTPAEIAEWRDQVAEVFDARWYPRKVGTEIREISLR